MTRPILVMGALGNVGAEVVRQLQAWGSPIRAADLNKEKILERFGSGVEAVRFDFTDAASYPQAFEGVEKMFLMRPPHIADIKRLMVPALATAKRTGVKHVVFLSLIGIEKARFVPHFKVEQSLQKIGFDTTFLRCSFFMQNLNTTHRQEIKERSEIFVPVGRARTSFIDVQDIGAVAALALTQPGHTNRNYDLTGSDALDYWQAARILSEVLGRRITYRNPNPLQFFIGSLRRGVPFDFALVTTGLYTSTRFGMAEVVTGETEKLLGRKPITFRQYAEANKQAWL